MPRGHAESLVPQSAYTQKSVCEIPFAPLVGCPADYSLRTTANVGGRSAEGSDDGHSSVPDVWH